MSTAKSESRYEYGITGSHCWTWRSRISTWDIVCPGIRDINVLSPLQIDVTTRQTHHLTFKASFCTALLPLGRSRLGAAFPTTRHWPSLYTVRPLVLAIDDRTLKRLHTTRCNSVHARHWHCSSHAKPRRGQPSFFSVLSSMLCSALSSRLFKRIYTPHYGYQTFVHL